MGIYASGADALCTSPREVLGLSAIPRRAILVSVENVSEIVRKRGGGLAALAVEKLPGLGESKFLETRVLEEMAKKLRDGFAAEGVVARVGVVEPGLFRQPASSDSFFWNVAVGVTGIVAGTAVTMFLWGRR